MRLPSASELPRAFACPESFSLPRVDGPPTVYGETGNTLHAYLRRIGKGEDREAALADVPLDDPGRQACEDVDIEQIPRGGHHELAMAWDPDTEVGVALGEDIGRAYAERGADRSRQFVGSLDYGGVLPDRRVLVLDYKSGWRVQRARDSWQLRGLAVYQAAIAGADEAIAAHLIMRGDKIRWDIVEWDAIALAGFRAELRDLAQRLRAQRPRVDLQAADVAEGEHCRYCAAYQRCPAKVGLVREMAGALGAGGALAPANSVFHLTAESAALAWRTLDRYDAIAKRMRAEITKLAELSPVDLGDGAQLRMVPGPERDKIMDAPGAVAFLRRHFDEQAAADATETSKSAIADAVKGWARRTGAKVGVAADQAIESLRTAGAIRKVAGETKVRETRRGVEGPGRA